MAQSLEAAFSPHVLGRTVELHRNHALDSQRLSSLFREDSEGVAGDLVEWDEVSYPRNLAPLVDSDSPSRRRKTMAKTKRSTPIAHIKLNKFIKASKIFLTENAVGELKPNANATIGREVVDMTNAIMRTREWLASKALAGSITVNSSTVEDSDISFTCTFAVNTFTFTSAWNLAATEILSDANELPLIKGAYSDDTSEELERAIFARGVETAMLGNTQIKGWVTSTNTGVQIMELGHIQKAGGLLWEKYDKSYIPTNGSVTQYIAAGYAIFLPQAAAYAEYLQYAVGQGIIPKSAIGSTSDGLMSVAPPGIYQYATLVEDPVGVKIFMGWSGFPIIKYPNIVVYARLY